MNMSFNYSQYPAGSSGGYQSPYGVVQPRTDSYMAIRHYDQFEGLSGSVASTPQPNTGSLKRGLTEDSEDRVTGNKRSAVEDTMSLDDKLIRDWGNMKKLQTYIRSLRTQPFNSSTPDQIFPAESQQGAYNHLSLYLSRAHLFPHEVRERMSTPSKSLSEVVKHLNELLDYNWASSEVSSILSQGINDAVKAKMVQQLIWSNWETMSRPYVPPIQSQHSYTASRPSFVTPATTEEGRWVNSTLPDRGWNSLYVVKPATAYPYITQSQDSLVGYTGFRKTQPTFGTPSMPPPGTVGDASDLNFDLNMDPPHGTTSQSQTGTDITGNRTEDLDAKGDPDDTED